MAIKTGLILVNLGSPEKPTKKGVSQFLRQFLSDKRVVELPPFFWQILLNVLVIPLRAKRVSLAYQSIWLESGSPLRVYTQRLAEGVGEALKNNVNPDLEKVSWAMTYGSPSIFSRIVELRSEGIDKILILPLYPQYSCSTTGAVYDVVADIVKSERNVPDIYVIKNYFSHPNYIDAMVESIKNHWVINGQKQKLLMSFHGIPVSCVEKGDPYQAECVNTANLLAESLGLDEKQWAISYQSRFGKQKWLQPYTNKILQSWGENGVESVDVICPSFAVDCLETLEEIDVEARQTFMQAGGKSYSLIPCLNASEEHICMVGSIVAEQICKN